jgi:alanine racemase
MARKAIAILSTQNLLHNLNIIKSQAPNSKIIAMVKANAYGHGLRSTSIRLQDHLDMLGVASIDEALALRKSGVKIPIMLAEGVFESEEITIAASEGFHVVFHHKQQIDWIENSDIQTPINAWIKINTGMGRLGFSMEKAKEYYKTLLSSDKIKKPLRVISHFACADEKEHELNQIQIDNFKTFIKDLDSEYSICNSAGIFHFPEMHYDYVRTGIALYGASPIAGKSAAELGLKPIMNLQTNLIAINNMKKDDSIGYGSKYICPEDMDVGVIAFGYGDGYPRSIEEGCPILVGNIECKIIGRVSMDMITIDLRNNKKAEVGDEVVLWGENLPVERIAEYSANVNYDILTGVQNRVKFIWTN